MGDNDQATATKTKTANGDTPTASFRRDSAGAKTKTATRRHAHSLFLTRLGGGEDEDGDGVGERDCFVGGQANDPRGAQPDTAEMSRSGGRPLRGGTRCDGTLTSTAVVVKAKTATAWENMTAS